MFAARIVNESLRISYFHRPCFVSIFSPSATVTGVIKIFERFSDLNII